MAGRADIRGKPRHIEVALKDYGPEQFDFGVFSSGFDANVLIELIPLSGKETRARIKYEIKAKSLSAKLTLQSARLTKSSLNKSFRQRLHNLGQDMEEWMKTA